MTAPLPVRPGTAEQLARIAHFRALDLPDVDELDMVARFLIGDVGASYEAAKELWTSIQDDCQRLWHLITDDWDDRDLDGSDDVDELTRHEQTQARLVCDIERTIWLARVAASDARRVVPIGAARMPAHLIGSERPGGGDPLGDYLYLKGER